MRLLEDLNREFREHYAIESDIAARAAGLRAGRPDAACRAGGRRLFRRARARARTSTGSARRRPTTSAGNCCWRAGWSEHGVRFIQICHAGGGNGGWDAHGDIEDPRAALPGNRQADRRADPRPQAARDARSRRWSSGPASSAEARGRRTRPAATTTPKATPSWLAGGGVKGGVVHGATDDVGYKAVENPHYYSDLHATILQQLGLDYKKMEHDPRPNLAPRGRRRRPIKEISDGSTSPTASPELLRMIWGKPILKRRHFLNRPFVRK